MTRLVKDFVDHPRSVGETYGEHWMSAMGFAVTMLGLAVACAVHAFVPGMFKTTASRTVNDLHRRMVTQRDRRHRADDAGHARTPSPTA